MYETLFFFLFFSGHVLDYFLQYANVRVKDPVKEKDQN